MYYTIDEHIKNFKKESNAQKIDHVKLLHGELDSAVKDSEKTPEIQPKKADLYDLYGDFIQETISRRNKNVMNSYPDTNFNVSPYEIGHHGLNNGKWPFGTVEFTEQGMIKLLILEKMELKTKTPSQIRKELNLRLGSNRSGYRCISMRLLRYKREGLVQRTRSGNSYYYLLAPAGVSELYHLKRKFRPSRNLPY